MLDTDEEKKGYRWAIVFVLSVYKAFLLKDRKACYPDVAISQQLRIHLFQTNDEFTMRFSHLLYQVLHEKLKCAIVHTGFDAFSASSAANPSISFSQTFPNRSQSSFDHEGMPMPSWHESLYFFNPNDPLLTREPQATSTLETLRKQFTTPSHTSGASHITSDTPVKVLFSPDTPEEKSQKRPRFFRRQELPHDKLPLKALTETEIFSSMRKATEKRAEAMDWERKRRRDLLIEPSRKLTNPTVAFLQPPHTQDEKFSAVSIGEDTTSSYLVIAYESRQADQTAPKYVIHTSPEQDVTTQKAFYANLLNFSEFKQANFILNHLEYLAIGYSQTMHSGALMHETVDLKNNLLRKQNTQLQWNRENGCLTLASKEQCWPIRTASYHAGGQRLAIGHCNMCAVLAICMGAKKLCLNLDSSSNGWFDDTPVSTFAFYKYERDSVLTKIVSVFKRHFDQTPVENSGLTLTSSAARDKAIRQRWYQGAAFALQELLTAL